MTGLKHIFRRAVLTALPHGGQKVARRNAWASLSADAAMARARGEAEAALAQVQPRQEHATR